METKLRDEKSHLAESFKHQMDQVNAELEKKVRENESFHKEIIAMRSSALDSEQSSQRLELANNRIKDLENLVSIQQSEKKKEKEKDNEISKICVQLHG